MIQRAAPYHKSPFRNMKKHHENFFQTVFSSYRIHSVIPLIFFRSESLGLLRSVVIFPKM